MSLSLHLLRPHAQGKEPRQPDRAYPRRQPAQDGPRYACAYCPVRRADVWSFSLSLTQVTGCHKRGQSCLQKAPRSTGSSATCGSVPPMPSPHPALRCLSAASAAVFGLPDDMSSGSLPRGVLVARQKQCSPCRTLLQPSFERPFPARLPPHSIITTQNNRHTQHHSPARHRHSRTSVCMYHYQHMWEPYLVFPFGGQRSLDHWESVSDEFEHASTNSSHVLTSPFVVPPCRVGPGWPLAALLADHTRSLDR